MNIQGQHVFNVSSNRLWEFITDPKAICQCLPEVKDLKIHDAEHFSATVRAGVAFLKGTFHFKFTILEPVKPSHVRLHAKGVGVNSSVIFKASINLTEHGVNETLVSWSVEVSVGGLIAGVGLRVMNSASEKIVTQLFTCIEAKLKS